MDALVAEAGRRPDRPGAHQPPGPLAGLLGELARGARLGRLAGVELARRHLEDHAAGRVPVLADQQHVAIRDEGHHRGGARMVHDVEIEQRAVGKLDALGDRLDAEAALHGLRVGGLAGRRHVSEGSPEEGVAMHGVPEERAVAIAREGGSAGARRHLSRRGRRLGRGRRRDRSATSVVWRQHAVAGRERDRLRLSEGRDRVAALRLARRRRERGRAERERRRRRRGLRRGAGPSRGDRERRAARLRLLVRSGRRAAGRRRPSARDAAGAGLPAAGPARPRARSRASPAGSGSRPARRTRSLPPASWRRSPPAPAARASW